MKYIITESRLEETIMNYFDNLFDIQNLSWLHPYDILDKKTGEEGEDKNRITFYNTDDSDDGSCFKWYSCEYFWEGSPGKDICPTVDIESPHANKLNGYFNDMWQEPFKKWIELHFNLPVKTVN